MAVPHFGHFIEVQGIPTTCLVFSPHFGQTQYPVGPAPIGPRCPPRPVPRPSTGPLPSGPVPSLPGILQNLPFKSYRLIASTGHSPTQAPHSIQSSLIVALLFSFDCPNGAYIFASAAANAFFFVNHSRHRKPSPYIALQNNCWLMPITNHSSIMGICQ